VNRAPDLHEIGWGSDMESDGEIVRVDGPLYFRRHFPSSTRVRFRVRYYAQFVCKPDRDPIFHLTPITMAQLPISDLFFED
jgi:hypothetical protein